ncbi:hypothetical protein EHS25_006548 [Saitozyma podzolica]|uniref:Uncharacterized protein n=1 Tax=Saitozyma podzolica TaxID=1890683 RepID=A0A427YSA2_9TREE|nr:hypothetical protein EHS25_006548 [Saitozyma podzolica]
MAEDNKVDGPTTFTPIHPFDMNDAKSWGRTIGMMDWDNDKIVFSKRSLLEFLKSMQFTVNTNFTEISKLPKYASFGKFSQAATDAAVADLVEAEIADPTHESSIPSSKSTVPRPSRKVIDPPGGKQSMRIFGEEFEETDALSMAPPRDGGEGVDIEVERMERMKVHVDPVEEAGKRIEEVPEGDRASNPPPGFRPSRKVMQGPGGASTMGQALFGGYEDETESDKQSARAPAGRKKQAPQSVSIADTSLDWFGPSGDR